MTIITAGFIIQNMKILEKPNPKNAGRKSLYGEPLVNISLTIPKFLLDEIDASARTQKDSRSRVIRDILEQAFLPAPSSGEPT